MAHKWRTSFEQTQLNRELREERSEENRHVTGGLAIVGGDETRIATLGTLFNFGSSSTELNRTAAI